MACEKVPAGHATHAVAPAPEYVPAEHESQPAVRPSCVEKEPAAHGAQSLVVLSQAAHPAAVLYVPARHEKHTDPAQARGHASDTQAWKGPQYPHLRHTQKPLARSLFRYRTQHWHKGAYILMDRLLQQGLDWQQKRVDLRDDIDEARMIASFAPEPSVRYQAAVSIHRLTHELECTENLYKDTWPYNALAIPEFGPFLLGKIRALNKVIDEGKAECSRAEGSILIEKHNEVAGHQSHRNRLIRLYWKLTPWQPSLAGEDERMSQTTMMYDSYDPESTPIRDNAPDHPDCVGCQRMSPSPSFEQEQSPPMSPDVPVSQDAPTDPYEELPSPLVIPQDMREPSPISDDDDTDRDFTPDTE